MRAKRADCAMPEGAGKIGYRPSTIASGAHAYVFEDVIDLQCLQVFGGIERVPLFNERPIKFA